MCLNENTENVCSSYVVQLCKCMMKACITHPLLALLSVEESDDDSDSSPESDSSSEELCSSSSSSLLEPPAAQNLDVCIVSNFVVPVT